MQATILNTSRASPHAWQDRLRDPSLTVLLVLQVFLLFIALPLAATGVPIAAPVAWLLLLVAVTLVVVLSRRVGASMFILLGLACAAASFALGRQWSPIIASVLNHGGFMLAFSALTWAVAHAIYAPGRITFHRLQGAMVIYLSLATIFANAFGLVWGLVPGAFANPPPAAPGASEFDTIRLMGVDEEGTLRRLNATRRELIDGRTPIPAVRNDAFSAGRADLGANSIFSGEFPVRPGNRRSRGYPR